MKSKLNPTNLIAAFTRCYETLFTSFLVMMLTRCFVINCDAQGTLTNGAIHDATIVVTNQVDSWNFTVDVGDRVYLHGLDLSGNTGFYPWLRLFSPSNVFIGDAADQLESR